MLKGKDMIGMQVVTRDTGEELGRVKDVIVHRTRKCVVGFLVRRGSLFQNAKAVSFLQVMSFANSAIMVPTASCVGGLDKIPDAARLLDRRPLSESSLLSSNGHEIGTVSDFFFDEKSGKLEGLEVITGRSEDAENDPEPEFLKLDDDLFVGRDDVIINEQAIARLIFQATEANQEGAGHDAPLVKNGFNGAESIVAPLVDRVETAPVTSRVDAAPHVNRVDAASVFSAPLVARSSVPPSVMTSVVHRVEPANRVELGVITKPVGAARVDLTVTKPIEQDQLKFNRDGSTLIVGFGTTNIPNDLSIYKYREQIERALGEHPNCEKLVFDVNNIKLLPSSMLGLLAGLRKKVGSLEVLNPTSDVREALKIMGFDKYMTVCDRAE